MSDAHLGPLIRLRGLTTAQLPPSSATADDLRPFLSAILREAVPFVDSAAPNAVIDSISPESASAVSSAVAVSAAAAASANASAKRKGRRLWHPARTGGMKMFRDPPATVHLTERVVSAAVLGRIAAAAAASSRGGGSEGTVGETVKQPHPTPERWVCRRSVHPSMPIPGSGSSEKGPGSGGATWAEFRDALKDRHAETEEAFTPSVVARKRVTEWDCGGIGVLDIDVEKEGGKEKSSWGNFTLCVEELRHRLGPLLEDRVFPVLQMTCSAMEGGSDGAGMADGWKEKHEFLVVSIAVSFLATAPDGAPQAELARDPSVTVGAYTAVERVRQLSVSDDSEGEYIEWVMATVSDARGVLPAWVQGLAVPGQIAKDVPLFLRWVAAERRAGRGPGADRPAEVVGETTGTEGTEGAGAEARPQA